MKKFEKKSAGTLERLRLRSGIYASAVTVLVLGLLALKRLRYSETAWQPDVVRQRFKSFGEQADHYYTDMIRQLKLLHYVPQTRETMKQFAARVEQGVGLEPDAMRQVFDIMMRWRYGQIEPMLYNKMEYM